MSSVEIAQSIRSAHLELAYERALRQAERIYEEERERALRVQLLLLEHENDELQEQAEWDEEDQQRMEETHEELHVHFSEIEAELHQTQMELKARLRELDHLRTEVNALNAASADATKILSEKLALARELNILKPEVEHLKSQASTQQKLLSEKLALQRELGSIQVELETEKRTVQRIKSQEKSSAREDSALTGEIEDLKKELTRSHRDAQKQDRENRKKTVEWEGEKEILEGKLDAFRNKLRSTKDQVKEAQDEIEKLQAEKMAQSAEMTKVRLNGPQATNVKKRNIARFDPDMTIGTPGHGGPAAKKQRFSVNVGDKSNFSITPFLNRTLSILPESPTEEEDKPEREREPETHHQPGGAAEERDAPKTKATKPKPERLPREKKQSAVITKANKLAPLKETPNTKVKTKPLQLASLVEESSDVDSDQELEAGASGKENAAQSDRSTLNRDTTESKKQSKPLTKRTNIFDEEDNAVAPKVRGLGRGPVGGGVLGRISLKAKPAGQGKTLAEFSPLKKDRRAVSVI